MLHSMRERKRGIQGHCLYYLTANADRIITIDEVAEATGNTTNAVSSAVSRLRAHYPDHLERRGTGVYLWHSETLSAPAPPVPAAGPSFSRGSPSAVRADAGVKPDSGTTEVLLRLYLPDSDGYRLGMDEESGQLYSVRLINLSELSPR